MRHYISQRTQSVKKKMHVIRHYVRRSKTKSTDIPPLTSPAPRKNGQKKSSNVEVGPIAFGQTGQSELVFRFDFQRLLVILGGQPPVRVAIRQVAGGQENGHVVRQLLHQRRIERIQNGLGVAALQLGDPSLDQHDLGGRLIPDRQRGPFRGATTNSFTG